MPKGKRRRSGTIIRVTAGKKVKIRSKVPSIALMTKVKRKRMWTLGRHKLGVRQYTITKLWGRLGPRKFSKKKAARRKRYERITGRISRKNIIRDI